MSKRDTIPKYPRSDFGITKGNEFLLQQIGQNDQYKLHFK